MTPEQFNQVADLLPEPLLLVSGDGVVVAANRPATELLGTGPLPGMRLAEVASDRSGDLDRYVRCCARTRERLPGALAIAGNDGSLQPYRCEGAVVDPQTESSPARILLRIVVPRESPLRQFVALSERMEQLHEEIRRRKRIEAQLREHRRQLQASAERLHMALEAGRMGTWEWDLETNKVTWSPNLEEIHGIPAGTFPGTLEAYQNDIHPDDRDRVFRALRAAVEGGQPYLVEYRLLWPDQSVHWVEARGRVVHERGRPTRMMGVCSDISLRKRDEDNARFLAEVSQALAMLTDFDRAMQTLVRLAVPFLADWSMACAASDDGG